MRPASPGRTNDLLLAARLCARDRRLGGLLLGGADADRRATAIAALVAALPADAQVRTVPAHVDLERLTGGLDLAAALAGEGVRHRPGLLAEAAGGLLVLLAADRLPRAAAALIGAAIDDGLLVAAFVDEEAPAPDLVERLAFHLRADAESVSDVQDGAVEEPGLIEAMAATAAALGVGSMRAPLLALRAAHASAALAGRTAAARADLAAAVRLVLAPRATRLPMEAAPEPPAPREEFAGEVAGEREGDVAELEDRVLAAVRASIDASLLARLASERMGRGQGRRARGAGERRRSGRRGRPTGTRAGLPRGGTRLALVETLRAAAPWQGVRGREGRVRLRASDLRVRRYRARAELVTIFAVDASGSTAASRLAEAKGAVELLLAQAYVQRAEAALIAFRGGGADVLLPPTRSLTRARRALADLPGGGGTPLGSGIAAAHALARAAQAKGSTPFVVVLSDGRANVAADGRAGRAEAERDALAAARLLASDAVAAAFVDTGARPRPEGARVAAAMGARYLPLPHARAEGLQAAVQGLAPIPG